MHKQALALVHKTIISLGMICGSIFANGGPVDWSNFKCMGTITPMKVTGISLEKERLNIVVTGDYSDVHAVYTLAKGKDYKAGQTITYGFPVDYHGWYSDDESDDSGIVKSFSMVCNDCTLSVISKYEPQKKSKNKNESESDTPWRRKWYVSSFPVPDSDTFELSVTYGIKNSFLDEWYTKNPFNECSLREIRYDLRPAKNWKTGTIKDLQITIDASDIINNFGTVNPGEFGFKKTAPGTYTFSKQTYAITQKSSFTFSYDDSIQALSKEIVNDRIPPGSLEVTASSSLAGNYGPLNTIDSNCSTAWVEGAQGNGIGSWIEFKIKGTYMLSHIGIMNGYWKSKATWEENSRPKKLGLEILEKKDVDKVMVLAKYTIDIPKERTYRNGVSIKNFYKDIFFLPKWNDVIADCKEVKKIKITILDVWPGTKYTDTALSEVFILGFRPEQ